MNPMFKQLIAQGKIKISEQQCSNDGCKGQLVEPLALNATRFNPFGHICHECDTEGMAKRVAKHIVTLKQGA